MPYQHSGVPSMLSAKSKCIYVYTTNIPMIILSVRNKCKEPLNALSVHLQQCLPDYKKILLRVAIVSEVVVLFT